MSIVRFSLAAAFLLAAPPLAGLQQASDEPDPHMERALRVLATTPLFDGHNDLPWQIRNFEPAPMDVAAYGVEGREGGHTDIPRLREGRVGAQWWSVYVPGDAVEEGAARYQLEQIDIALELFHRFPEHFELALSADDVMRIFHEGKIASLLGMEGGHAIENSLGALRAFHALGARYMGLTHNRDLDWADSHGGSHPHGGLTPFGREVVREMNRLGMLVDLSHASDAVMSQALDVSEAPVIFSHSSVRALRDHTRNVPDSILRRLPENGGLIMITFVPSFLTEADEATLYDVVAHIEHARDVAGLDHVGIAGDYDGIVSVPVGLEDVSTYPALFAELSRRGWSEQELRKLAGESSLRVMREAEAVARRLRAERGPSMATIDEMDGSGSSR
jgi:membrane dipeptidase